MSLRLQDIRHRFGDGVSVVDGASIEAAPGEIVCLFGPSGCGKTTLLRIAAGLERVQAGAVEIDGVTVATPEFSAPAERRRIGFVFQDFVLFPHLTVAENVAFGLDKLQGAERATRVEDELRSVGLLDLKDRFPHELSGGQQQRAALARAFAPRPRAMLLDEPFASIDVALRQRLRAEMRRLLKARSTPAVLVTHDPAEAIELGDRIAIMDAGRIIEAATPERLYLSPKSLAGACIFPGAQAFPCAPVDGGVSTEFGNVGFDAASNATAIVVHDGGMSARPDDKGECAVIDCRFAGPHWLLTIVGRAGGQARASCDRPVSPGEKAAVAIDPAKVRVVAS